MQELSLDPGLGRCHFIVYSLGFSNRMDLLCLRERLEVIFLGGSHLLQHHCHFPSQAASILVHLFPSLVLEGHTSAGHMPEAHLLVTVKPDTLEPEAACTPDARRGSSPTSPPAVCCKSANIPHFLHTLSLLLQWVYLLRKWPRQTQSIYSADSASSVVSLRLDF